MRIRSQRGVLRFINLLCLTTIVATGAAASALAQAGSGAAGTVKGFVRVNGKTLTVSHASAVTAPDSFDPSQEVRLVLITPTPIAAAALAKATDRNAVFGLVPAGAIVEIGKNGHTVFLLHAALGGMRLQTGGGFPEFKTANNRISGDVHTFMSGDQDEFGFKVRFELAFDAPIVKRLPLGKPTVAPAPPEPKPVPSGPAPKSKAEAVKWLEAQDLGVGATPNNGLVSYLVFKEKWSTDVVGAYLLAGAVVTKPHSLVDGYALNTAAIMCEGKPAAAEIVKMLLAAGANINQKDVDGPKATAPMLGVRCIEVLKVLLAAKPDLNVVDVRGFTVMHHALIYGNPTKVAAQMVKDAGFDLKRWRSSLYDSGASSDLLNSLYGAGPAPTPAPSAPATRATTPPTPAPAPARATAIDWKALGPYPLHSRTEAARLLARPGTDITADEHFWDAISRREPQRLAVALQAGANVKQLRSGNNYTPIISLVESCDLDRDPEAQVSIAEQLIAAGADVGGLDYNKANALAVAADDCPIGVIHALIKAGVPLQAAYLKDQTALRAAITDGRVDVVEALLDAGLDVKKEPYNVGRMASGNKAIEAALKKKRK